MKANLNLWDTATVYGICASEKIIGSFVKNVEHEKIFISTKFTPQIAGMYENSVEKVDFDIAATD